MRILVCGCRDWANWDKIAQALEGLDPDTTVIHGGARGADTMAGWYAKHFGYQIEVYRAEWDRYGKAAGPIRNQKMLQKGKPDRAIAFWDGESRGTEDMIKRLRSANVPLTIVFDD